MFGQKMGYCKYNFLGYIFFLQEMEFEIQKFVNCTKQLTYDSVVLAILSHGEEDLVFGVDGLAIKIDDIIKHFNGTNNPALCGKPKLFIFQLCRGSKFQYFLYIIYFYRCMSRENRKYKPQAFCTK